MIEGFEDYTIDITENEIDIAMTIAKGLRARVGAHKAITNKGISDAMKVYAGEDISSAKMRRFIQYIRSKGMVKWLCASSKGYYVAETKEEWIAYREGFRSRIRSMQFTLACMDLDN